MNRRAFLTTTGGVVIAAAPARAARRPPLLRGGHFSEGVLSGDPTPTAITLATRLVGVEGTGAVTLEIARDRGFDRVVTRSRLRTGPGLGHAVKARVNGLKPHTQYWYRFAGRTAHSPVGRFRTSLPPDSRQVVQFGIVYGLDYNAGYFNAAALLADEDVDFVLNLGNYIAADPVPADEGVRAPYEIASARSLASYRRRYRRNRADANLRRMHAAHSLVSTWDDGEVATGYAGADTAASLKSAAYRAWFEAMPHYPRQAGTPRVYGRPRFGRGVELFVCDTRQYRQTAPAAGSGVLLGATQSRSVRGRLKTSRATWKLVASPTPVAELLGPDGQPIGTEGWQGYADARSDLLATLGQNHVEDVVILSGGRRRFYAADLADAAGAAVAPEFGCATVSQRTEAEAGEATATATVAGALEDDGAHHGYAVCSVAPDLLTMRFEKLSTVRSASSATDDRSVFALPAGSGRLQAP